MKKIISLDEKKQAERLYDRIIAMWEAMEALPEDKKQAAMNAIVSHAVNRGEQVRD